VVVVIIIIIIIIIIAAAAAATEREIHSRNVNASCQLVWTKKYVKKLVYVFEIFIKLAVYGHPACLCPSQIKRPETPEPEVT
jgi:hypothetical protein